MAQSYDLNDIKDAVERHTAGEGHIVRIVGPVVDVKFEGQVPAIYNALTVEADTPMGHVSTILEVESQLPGGVVRTVAMSSTDGLIRAAKKGAWLIDLTTSSPQLARDIHDAAEVEDKHAFDCPVTGGEQGAIDGTLTLIIGAAEKDVAPVMPLLECFSSRRFFFDQPGGGQTAKLCNQVSLASCMVGYADALALAEQSGIDAEKVLEVMASGTGGSGASKTLAPKSLAGDYKPGFLAEHLRKDIALALQRSEDLEITLPGAETAFTLFDMLCQIGGSRMGTQALTLLYQEEGTCAAAGLDWSLLEQGDEDDEHECCCGHDHGDDDHECCGGHGHHHDGDHECCGGHGHHHDGDHECHCHDHDHEGRA